MDAEGAERRHDVPTALRARLAVVASGTGTWEYHHQLGVDLSELADSACRRRWWGSATLLLHRAFREFRDARDMAPKETVPHAAITCDEAIAHARYEFWGGDEARVTSATNAVARGIEALEPLAQENDAALHQLAISLGFMARLAYGEALSLHGTPNLLLGAGYNERALAAFGLERDSTPDEERAYRSHLLAVALANGKAGSGAIRRRYAEMALISAQVHHDGSHAARARAIWLLGNPAENFLRRRRDSKTILQLIEEKIWD